MEKNVNYINLVSGIKAQCNSISHYSHQFCIGYVFRPSDFDFNLYFYWSRLSSFSAFLAFPRGILHIVSATWHVLGICSPPPWEFRLLIFVFSISFFYRIFFLVFFVPLCSLVFVIWACLPYWALLYAPYWSGSLVYWLRHVWFLSSGRSAYGRISLCAIL